MARVAKKIKPAKDSKYVNLRTGLMCDPNDVALLEAIRQALSLERGGPVTLSETVRDAIRFRAKKRGIEIAG
jgi:hypothetical protein